MCVYIYIICLLTYLFIAWAPGGRGRETRAAATPRCESPDR